MLKEILGVADDPPARRRWFHDDYFDLFVWQAGGEVTLIQVCYGADATERALVWDKERVSSRTARRRRRKCFALRGRSGHSAEEVRRDVREKMHEFAGRRWRCLPAQALPARLLAALAAAGVASRFSATMPSQGRGHH